MLSEIIKVTGILLIISFFHCSNSNNYQDSSGKPDIPHVDFIVMTEIQPQENDPATIWYDEFESDKAYLESSGPIDPEENFGIGGGSMRAGFKKGDVTGEGNRKVAFGDFPGGSKVVSAGKQFDSIYWRIYVKHEYGWEGSPAKMSRATSIVSERWQQSMIAHVWSGSNNSLTLDPASGVKGQTDSIQTNKYNDFPNLRWLGNKPASSFQLSSTNESGYWVLVEASAKLNTPGRSDGSCRLWIDGRFETERRNLNFRGSYTRHGINAVFLESYWNSGALKTEGRWFDNFIISTKPIGPVSCPANPVISRTAYHGPGEIADWKLEIAADYEGMDIVFRSESLKKEAMAIVNTETGSFTGSLAGNGKLVPGQIYFCRICQQSSNGQWSDWSRWHQPFNISDP